MGKYFYLLLVLGTFCNSLVSQNSWATVRISCSPEKENDSFLYWDDFPWGLEHSKLSNHFEKIYLSKKRLKNRAYFDATSGAYIFHHVNSSGNRIPIQIPEKFIASIRRHIEEALRLQYAEAIMFTDMGHAHFFMPEKIYQEKYAKISNENTSDLLAGYIQEDELKILYHTAEQIALGGKNSAGDFELLQDKWLQWRYHSRNIVGKNNPNAGLEVIFAVSENFNTVRDYADHHYGYGFSLSANQNACFPFQWKGKTYYFDLSIDEISTNPASGGGDYRLKSGHGHRSLQYFKER